MPCSGPGGPTTKAEYHDMNDLTRTEFEAMLCAAFTYLEHVGKNPLLVLDFREAGVEQRHVENWWIEHKRRDTERRAREIQAKQLEKIQQQALAKLTPEELAAIKLLRTGR